MSPSPSGNDPSAVRPFSISVVEGSQVGEARRRVAALAGGLGFDETQAGKAVLVAAELAGNLVKHARDGELLVRPLEQGGTAGIEILALDRGPGMADPARCLRDGYSTAGSPGTGLGAAVRLSAASDIYSSVPAGTAVLSRIWPGPRPPAPGRLTVGAVCFPRAGEVACGDAWDAVGDGPRDLYLVADGLGHGPGAAAASREAERAFRDNARGAPAEIVRALHDALRPTRGAAVAVAALDLGERVLRFAGVGNIAGSVVAGGSARSLVSCNGTVGHTLHKVQEFSYPFPEGALLVLHSDGLGSRWNLNAYPGLAARHPALVAGVLYRDFKRGRDDVTVLAVREPVRVGDAA